LRTTDWYLAELVIRIDFLNVPPEVNVDIRLVRAASDELAFEKALDLGEKESFEYTNSDQEKVVRKFLGLRNLYHIYENPDDGSELIYEKHFDLTETEISSLVLDKSDLSIFRANRENANTENNGNGGVQNGTEIAGQLDKPA
jgi:hypothetical protein